MYNVRQRKYMKIHDTILFILASFAYFWAFSTFVGGATNILIPHNHFYRIVPEFLCYLSIVWIYMTNHLALYPQSEKSLKGTYKWNGWLLIATSIIILILAIVYSATGITHGIVQDALGPIYPLDTYLLPFVIAGYGIFFVMKSKNFHPEDYKYDKLGNPRHVWHSIGMFFEGQMQLWCGGALLCPLFFSMNWGNPEWYGPFLIYVALGLNIVIYIYYHWRIRDQVLSRAVLTKRYWTMFALACLALINVCVVFTALSPDVVSLYMAWTFQMDLMTSKFITAYFVPFTTLIYVIPKLIRFYAGIGKVN